MKDNKPLNTNGHNLDLLDSKFTAFFDNLGEATGLAANMIDVALSDNTGIDRVEEYMGARVDVMDAAADVIAALIAEFGHGSGSLTLPRSVDNLDTDGNIIMTFDTISIDPSTGYPIEYNSENPESTCPMFDMSSTLATVENLMYFMGDVVGDLLSSEMPVPTPGKKKYLS